MRTIWVLLRPYLRAHRLDLAVAVVAMGGEVATAMLLPIPAQRAVDLLVKAFRHVGAGASVPLLDSSQTLQLVLLAGALLVIAVLDAGFSYLVGHIASKIKWN